MTKQEQLRAMREAQYNNSAFDYDADVTEEAVRIIQDRATKVRQGEEVEVVEGYVGKLRKCASAPVRTQLTRLGQD